MSLIWQPDPLCYFILNIQVLYTVCIFSIPIGFYKYCFKWDNIYKLLSAWCVIKHSIAISLSFFSFSRSVSLSYYADSIWGRMERCYKYKSSRWKTCWILITAFLSFLEVFPSRALLCLFLDKILKEAQGTLIIRPWRSWVEGQGSLRQGLFLNECFSVWITALRSTGSNTWFVSVLRDNPSYRDRFTLTKPTEAKVHKLKYPCIYLYEK